MTKSVFSKEYQSLLALLVQSRQERGITQRQLGRRLGRDQSFVSKYERGVRRLDVIEFTEVVEAMGADPFEMLRQARERAGKAEAVAGSHQEASGLDAARNN